MDNPNMTSLDQDSFETEVLKQEGISVVDFYADWCNPCQLLLPILDELAVELKDNVKFFKCNIEGQREIARKYKVMSIPTIIFFKNGEVMDKLTGLSEKKEILKFVNKML